MASKQRGRESKTTSTDGFADPSSYYAEGAGKYAQRFHPTNYFFYNTEDDETKYPGEHSLNFRRATQTHFPVGDYSKNQGGFEAFRDDSHSLNFVDHLGNEFRWAPGQDDEPGEIISAGSFGGGGPTVFDIRYPVNWFMLSNRLAALRQFSRRFPGESSDSEKFKDFEERYRKIVMTDLQPLRTGDVSNWFGGLESFYREGT